MEWAGGAEGYSFSRVLADPAGTIGILLNTLFRRLPEYVYGMLGGSLGWLQYETDGVLVLFLLAWTALTVLPARGEAQCLRQCMPAGHRTVSLLACFLVLLATMLVMLMSWTPLGSSVVEGVQGRYFLPVLPLALTALRSRRLVVEQNIDGILLGGYCVVNLLVLQGIVGRM